MTAALLDERRPLPRMTPAQYVTAVAGQISGGDKCSARLAVLVLHAIADMADWQAWSWGEHSYRSAERIAASIGYTERAVRHAYKVLTAAGWLLIEDRPGRTNVFTVLAPVDPPATPPKPMWSRGGRRVHNHLRAVDNPVDNRASVEPVARSHISGGAETGSPDLGNPPTETPPKVPPSARKSNADGADAPAQTVEAAAAPRREQPASSSTPAPVAGTPPSESASTDAGPADVSATGPPPAAHPLDGATSLVNASRRLGWGDPPPGWARGAVSGQPARRDSRRRAATCPTCGASPGETCRGRRGRPRTANHDERR